MDSKFQLGEYFRTIFDLNKDGKVSFKEFFSVLMPNQAVALAFLVIDLLALLGEYRVWSIGMVITSGNYAAAAGFVAVSLVPFYLAQVLWLYPLATGWQQTISVVMLIAALFTSANFGLADLSRQYDIVTISRMVIYLWLLYITLLLLYVVSDKAFRLHRTKIIAKKNAEFQTDMHRTMTEVLESVEQSLLKEKELRARFGDSAVDAHLQMLTKNAQGQNGKGKGNNNGNQPKLQAPKPAPEPKPEPKEEPAPEPDANPTGHQ